MSRDSAAACITAPTWSFKSIGNRIPMIAWLHFRASIVDLSLFRAWWDTFESVVSWLSSFVGVVVCEPGHAGCTPRSRIVWRGPLLRGSVLCFNPALVLREGVVWIHSAPSSTVGNRDRFHSTLEFSVHGTGAALVGWVRRRVVSSVHHFDVFSRWQSRQPQSWWRSSLVPGVEEAIHPRC